jgi:hypothetical protein
MLKILELFGIGLCYGVPRLPLKRAQGISTPQRMALIALCAIVV